MDPQPCGTGGPSAPSCRESTAGGTRNRASARDRRPPVPPASGAARRGAALRVLHAWRYSAVPGPLPPAEWYRDGAVRRERCEAAVPVFAAAALREEYPDVEVRTESVSGSPGRALVEASEDADVVVLCVRRARHAAGFRFGPVTRSVLRGAHCPVVLVPVP
ncbi:universal stress protein [Streptomyces mobaraensis]|uniref:universal stress protein n=1 Tax=Streptomyces mobaraensis TaxID=35621 RepID=UPI000996BBE2|nr:universal stress protein [Streptomyces mobaraensis]